jgi:hypothetical protein
MLSAGSAGYGGAKFLPRYPRNKAARLLLSQSCVGMSVGAHGAGCMSETGLTAIVFEAESLDPTVRLLEG